MSSELWAMGSSLWFCVHWSLNSVFMWSFVVKRFCDCIVYWSAWRLVTDKLHLYQDPDDTLKRKTFELLYKMTKSSNVEVIVDRMIDYMISINDNHYKTEIASRCVELAEQFAPSNHWFIQVLCQSLPLSSSFKEHWSCAIFTFYLIHLWYFNYADHE